MYLSSIIFITALLSLAGCSTKEAVSNTLFPPQNIPFKNDALIKKYLNYDVLSKFRYVGKWETNKVNSKFQIKGISTNSNGWLISKDYLTKTPKSLKIDFRVKNRNNDYGFMLGTNGVVVRSGIVYVAKFDNISGFPKISPPIRSIAIEYRGNTNFSTFTVTTGHDPIGGAMPVCNMYINGIGLSVKCPKDDVPFGVYIGPQNSIILDSFRWDIGSL